MGSWVSVSKKRIMSDTELYVLAEQTWGIEAQKMVFHEELAELLEVICGYADGSLLCESADALMMTSQMAYACGANIRDVDIETFGLDVTPDVTFAYFNVCKKMSHYMRGRCEISDVRETIISLYGHILINAIETGLLASEIYDELDDKHHKLAGMLGVSYLPIVCDMSDKEGE